jgi:hypothetical protein
VNSAYTHQEFPKWLYHVGRSASVAHDPEEEKCFGEDWFDNAGKTKEANEAMLSKRQITLFPSSKSSRQVTK